TAGCTRTSGANRSPPSADPAVRAWLPPRLRPRSPPTPRTPTSRSGRRRARDPRGGDAGRGDGTGRAHAARAGGRANGPVPRRAIWRPVLFSPLARGRRERDGGDVPAPARAPSLQLP